MWCLELLDTKAESGWVLQPSPLWSSPHTAGQSHTFRCSSIGSHLQRQSSLNFSSVGLSHGLQLHELLHHWVLSTGSVFQERAASDSSNKPAPVWTSLSIGPQVLPGTCSSVVFPGHHGLLWAPTCSSVGALHGLRLGLCCPIISSTGHNPFGWSSSLPSAAALPWSPASPGTW